MRDDRVIFLMVLTQEHLFSEYSVEDKKGEFQLIEGRC